MLNKISSITLYVLIGLTVIVSLMFFMGGYVDPDAEYVEPIYTGLLMNFMYGLCIVAAAFVVVSQLVQFIIHASNNIGEALRTLVPLGSVAILLLITWFIAAGDPVTVIGSDEVISFGTFKAVDMQLYSIYALSIVGLFLMVFGGIAKKIK